MDDLRDLRVLPGPGAPRGLRVPAPLIHRADHPARAFRGDDRLLQLERIPLRHRLPDEVAIFRHSADPNEAMKEVDGEMGPYYGTRSMGGSVYSTPAIAGNVLYISNPTHLFAITPDGK